MKAGRLIEAEQISLEEVSEDIVAVKWGDDRFVIDVDTLCDLSYRFAAFLSYLESREQSECLCKDVLH